MPITTFANTGDQTSCLGKSFDNVTKKTSFSHRIGRNSSYSAAVVRQGSPGDSPVLKQNEIELLSQIICALVEMDEELMGWRGKADKTEEFDAFTHKID